MPFSKGPGYERRTDRHELAIPSALTDDPAQDVAQAESSSCLASDFNFPNWCAQPTDKEASGFEIDNQWALIRWDVAGGFQYT